MPQSAIDAGVIDHVLTPSQIAAFVIREFAEDDPGMPPFRPRADNLIKYFGNLDRLLNNLNRPILVLDEDLRIVGFGGAIQELLPAIDADIGRRVANLSLMVDYDTLAADARDVFQTSKTKEIQVTGPEGASYLLRIASGDYAPARDPICIVSLIPFSGDAGSHARDSQELGQVARFGVVMAHVDDELRYTWILNPHPDFAASDVIGKTDVELAQNEGVVELMNLKKRVLERGVSEESVIGFPLSDGQITYLISANAILDKRGQTIGVSTVGVEFAR
jgi:hypothetical protein